MKNAYRCVPYGTSGDNDQFRGNALNLTQNQVVATSCWFESGQGHQFRFRQFPVGPGADASRPRLRVGRTSGSRFHAIPGAPSSRRLILQMEDAARVARAQSLAMMSAARGSADPGLAKYRGPNIGRSAPCGEPTIATPFVPAS